MDLKNVLPVAAVSSKFSSPVTVRELFLSDIDKFTSEHPSTTRGIGLCIWHQIASRGMPAVDPYLMAEEVDSQDPFLYRSIEQKLGVVAIRDFYWRQMRLQGAPNIADDVCADFCLAATHPNDLTIADVSFSNPLKPLKRPRYTHQRFAGLGLFKPFLAGVMDYCSDAGIDRIVLVAAHEDLIPLFSRFGFSVDDGPMAAACLASGLSIPMHRIV